MLNVSKLSGTLPLAVIILIASQICSLWSEQVSEDMGWIDSGACHSQDCSEERVRRDLGYTNHPH